MTVTVPTLVVVLPVVLLVALAWYLFARWLMDLADPYVRRWIWRRCVGVGEPPARRVR